jgi:hypothetical protein
MIANCSCSHEYQDRLYGKGKRVFNLGKTNYRCTVCRATIPLSYGEKKEAAITKKVAK